MINGFHELVHDSVFRTQFLNAFFLRIFSFLGWYSHHHSSAAQCRRLLRCCNTHRCHTHAARENRPEHLFHLACPVKSVETLESHEDLEHTNITA